MSSQDFFLVCVCVINLEKEKKLRLKKGFHSNFAAAESTNKIFYT